MTSVLRSRILHGSVVWFTAPRFSKVMKLFSLLKNEANRMILGAFKTSPTELMHHDSNLIPFSIAATRQHHLFLHKRMAAAGDHPIKAFIKHELKVLPKTHKGPITNLIRFDDFVDLHQLDCEIIKPFPSAPWENSTGELHNLHLTREEAMEAIPQQIIDGKSTRRKTDLYRWIFDTRRGWGSGCITNHGA